MSPLSLRTTLCATLTRLPAVLGQPARRGESYCLDHPRDEKNLTVLTTREEEAWTTWTTRGEEAWTTWTTRGEKNLTVLTTRAVWDRLSFLTRAVWDQVVFHDPRDENNLVWTTRGKTRTDQQRVINQQK